MSEETMDAAMLPPVCQRCMLRLAGACEASSWHFEHCTLAEAARKSQGVELFVICEHPKDYPDDFVVRRWVAADGRSTADPAPVLICHSLQEARRPLQERGLTCLGRDQDDDPVIVEVWI